MRKLIHSVKGWWRGLPLGIKQLILLAPMLVVAVWSTVNWQRDSLFRSEQEIHRAMQDNFRSLVKSAPQMPPPASSGHKPNPGIPDYVLSAFAQWSASQLPLFQDAESSLSNKEMQNQRIRKIVHLVRLQIKTSDSSSEQTPVAIAEQMPSDADAHEGAWVTNAPPRPAETDREGRPVQNLAPDDSTADAEKPESDKADVESLPLLPPLPTLAPVSVPVFVQEITPTEEIHLGDTSIAWVAPFIIGVNREKSFDELKSRIEKISKLTSAEAAEVASEHKKAVPAAQLGVRPDDEIIVYPNQSAGKVWCSKHIGTSVEDSAFFLVGEYDIQELQRFPVLGIAALAAFLITSIVMLNSAVITPIRVLSRSVRIIASEGDYSKSVVFDRRDEVGELQASLNALLGTIREQFQRNQSLQSDLRSERDNLERAVQERTFELEQANKELNSFAYTVSHDLQEPLRNIMFIIDDLKRKWTTGYDVEIMRIISRLTNSVQSLTSAAASPKNNGAGQAVEDLRDLWISQIHSNVLGQISEITGQAEREITMVKRILEIARTGRAFKKSRVDLTGIVEEVKASLGGRLDESGVRLDYPDSLPVISGDGVLMHQVLQNLISNAIKYNDKAEKTVRIMSDLADEPGWWKISVQDNGIGIREKDRSKVFEIFTQLHSPRKFERGIGAGLTIVKKIIERHGGSINFQSVPGEGTTFFFTLPAFQERLDER